MLQKVRKAHILRIGFIKFITTHFCVIALIYLHVCLIEKRKFRKLLRFYLSISVFPFAVRFAFYLTYRVLISVKKNYDTDHLPTSTKEEMALGLYSLIEAVLLCLNAVCVLHEERFLAKSISMSFFK